MESRTSLLSLWTDLYGPRNLADASPQCRAQYKANIIAFGRWLGHDARSEDLTDDNLLAFVRSIRAKGRSPATANKVRSQLVALWRFLARKRIVEIWPDVPTLKEFRRVPVGWTDEQIDRLFAACANVEGYVDCIPAFRWWTALHFVLWDSGIRIGAALKLAWEHFDLSAPAVIVPAEIQKQAADQRFDLFADTVFWLRSIIEPERRIVFPWPMCRDSLWNHYKRLLKAAELPTDRRSKFHRMRRSHASHLTAAGGDATASLGHSGPAMTRRHYLDPAITGGQNAAAMLRRPRFVPVGELYAAPPLELPRQE